MDQQGYQQNNESLEPIAENISNLKPQGFSKFAKSPFFHDMLNMIASGKSIVDVAKWSQIKEYPVKPKHIKEYLKEYLPNLLPHNNPAIPDVNSSVNALVEIEKLCRDVKKQIIAEKTVLKKHGAGTTSKKLSELQRSYMSTLEALNRIKMSQRSTGEDDKEKVVDKWHPEFAAAIAKLIVREKSKEDGLLREFQPEKMVDPE